MSKYGYYLGMTPEQQDIVKMIREFAERELDPVVKEYDEKGEFPVQLHEKWGEWVCLVWTCQSSTADWDSTP